MIVDHLSIIESTYQGRRGLEIEESFPDEKLFKVKIQLHWYEDLVNYLAYGIVPHELTYQKKKKLRHEAKFFIWYDPLLFRNGAY